jgi:hypothetical protein
LVTVDDSTTVRDSDESCDFCFGSTVPFGFMFAFVDSASTCEKIAQLTKEIYNVSTRNSAHEHELQGTQTA